jgi:hypothetical protein
VKDRYKLIGFVVANIHIANVYEMRDAAAHVVVRRNSYDIFLTNSMEQSLF